jgi:murein DD-endopeptidase MepM/ murein hydrolase activator NlpD
MFKTKEIIILILVSLSLFGLGFNYRTPREPNVYYQVFIDDSLIGIVKNDKNFLSYIDKKEEQYKEKYGVDKVLPPEGVNIKKIVTFHNDVSSNKEVYEKMIKVRQMSILAYEFKLNDQLEVKTIYVTEEEVFNEAVEEVFKTFIGTARYESYVNKTQESIRTTGNNIRDVYIDEEIIVKNTRVSVDEQIFNDSKDLARYLLYKTTNEHKTYIVKQGDTIESISFRNRISVEEFLISNPKFSSSKNLLFPGQIVMVGMLDPQMRVVVEEYVVADITNRYNTEYINDPTLYIGVERVVRPGQNGMLRIAQNRTIVNGQIVNISEPISKVELSPAVNRIVRTGAKRLPSNVGDIRNWRWPTSPGWTVTSGFGWRINPVTKLRQFHEGIDIAGTGLNSPIYAINNGTIYKNEYTSSYGYYVIINHNNGYYSIYAHLSRRSNAQVGETVARGDVIGGMGSTGQATGVHLHFAVYDSVPHTGRPPINPWRLY